MESIDNFFARQKEARKIVIDNREFIEGLEGFGEIHIHNDGSVSVACCEESFAGAIKYAKEYKLTRVADHVRRVGDLVTQYIWYGAHAGDYLLLLKKTVPANRFKTNCTWVKNDSEEYVLKCDL